MSMYEITPLVLGRYSYYEMSWLLFNKGCGEKTESLVMGFLIRGGGKNILVDTGCGENAAESHSGIEKTEEMDLLVHLEKLGILPDDIDAIVHTHLHWDCCGGDQLFPQAPIYVQRREVQYAIQPLPCQYEEYETPHAGFSYPWLRSMDRFVLSDGEQELYPGLRLLPLPGHSPGFQGIVVETAKGRCVVAGDSVPLYQNWTGLKNGDHIPSAIHVNTIRCLESFARIAQEGQLLLAGRDPRAAEGICVEIDGRGGESYVKL